MQKHTGNQGIFSGFLFFCYDGNLSLLSFSSSVARRFQRHLPFNAPEQNMPGTAIIG
jgi:hypothetical protein